LELGGCNYHCALEINCILYYPHSKSQKIICLWTDSDSSVDANAAITSVSSFRACLVATIQSTGAAQSTIKLVATNLIANGNIWEGVQLLCLIGKGLDACRYLLSYSLWEAAVWLAKSVLPTPETHEVMRKWADHLWVSGQKVSTH
jgi:hypothetical protein